MQTVIEALRQIIGSPNFYKPMGYNDNYSWDYGAMIEYLLAGMIVLVVVSSVFRLLHLLIKH